MSNQELGHIKQAAFERGFQKQALSLGTILGALYGTAKGGDGNRGEGLAHGAVRGLGADLGLFGGSLLGGLPSLALKSSKGAGLAALLGILGGGGLGAYGGWKGMGELMGKAPWQ